jgi:hypothetical protein
MVASNITAWIAGLATFPYGICLSLAYTFGSSLDYITDSGLPRITKDQYYMYSVSYNDKSYTVYIDIYVWTNKDVYDADVSDGKYTMMQKHIRRAYVFPGF